ncbi:MAG: peptidoglycan DD-metalloendopeptidase family protein [Cyclobacteriaceae bacterium]|nr:peptidoglycan DD-metalloendopeptidase family protein [Cyclobacteriaceae bacterium]
MDYNQEFEYEYTAVSSSGKPVTYQVELPDWMIHDEASLKIKGTPLYQHSNRDYKISITATDGENIITQNFSLEVVRAEFTCDVNFGEPSKSPYALPFDVGTSSRIIQGYCRSGTGGHIGYFAYDFALNMFDTLRAARSGVVMFVQESFVDGNKVPGQENFVIVEHDDKTAARYVHMTKNGVLVDVGQRVTQGQPIGLNGLTGATTSPHLHFDVFRSRNFGGFPALRAQSLPVNFSNAQGTLDQRNGLREGSTYSALPL